MIVRVNLSASPAEVSLESVEDCGRFQVAAAGGSGPADLGAALRALGAGRPADDADHVWVSVDAVRSLASGQVDADWDGRFDAMLSYADTKGWLSADRRDVRAHVEWPA